MSYLPSRYPYTAEYRFRQRPSKTPYLTNYRTSSRQRSPLLPVSSNETNPSSWKFFDKLKNMWSWKYSSLSVSAEAVLYTPLYLPSPSEFLHPRPAPLPPSNAIGHLPYGTSYSRPPLGQNIINMPHAFDISPALPSIRRRKELFASDQPTFRVSIPRHSKRSRPPHSPRRNVHETRSQEDGARKRVRFSTEVLPSDISGLGMYNKLPTHKTGSMGLWKNHFLPFADWIAYHCNNVFTEDNCSKLVMTRVDEKRVALKITAIFEEYFPMRNSVDGLEAPTATFLALWYLGRLFRRGIFCFSDVENLGAPEAMIRAFLLGLTLADKWLNDGSRRLKDWSKFCRIPLHSRTSVEKRALRMLDYNICITNLEWRNWLDRLEPATSKFVSENFTHSTQITAEVALKNLRRAKGLDKIPIRGPLRPREVEISNESLSFLREDLLADHCF